MIQNTLLINHLTPMALFNTEAQPNPARSFLAAKAVPSAYSRNVVWLYVFTLEQIRLG